jgi:hypothetical protein
LRKDAQLTQKMGNENAKEKKRARNADKGKKGVNKFPERGVIEGPDRTEVDQEAEAQAEEEEERFDHGPDCSA